MRRALLLIGVMVVAVAASAADAPAPKTDAPAPATDEPAPMTDAAPTTEWPTSRESYTCTPAQASSQALSEELNRFAARQARSVASLEAKRAELEALKAALVEQSLRLEAAVAAAAAREQQEKEASRSKVEKAAEAQRIERETSLAKMLGKMGAGPAAALLSLLDKDLAAALLRRMPTSRAGEALAAMKPPTAAALARVAATGEQK